MRLKQNKTLFMKIVQVFSLNRLFRVFVYDFTELIINEGVEMRMLGNIYPLERKQNSNAVFWSLLGDKALGRFTYTCYQPIFEE